jgi:hypothetical protein
MPHAAANLIGDGEAAASVGDGGVETAAAGSAG